MARTQTPFELSVDTTEIGARLREVAPGDVINYDVLSEVIGRNVRGEAAHCLASARRRLIRDDNIVFETVRKVGLKRLRVAEVVKGVLPETTHKMRGLVRRQAKKLGTAEPVYESLDKDHKIAFNTARAFLGTLKEISKETSVKKVEKYTRDADKPLPLAATLDAFKK